MHSFNTMKLKPRETEQQHSQITQRVNNRDEMQTYDSVFYLHRRKHCVRFKIVNFQNEIDCFSLRFQKLAMRQGVEHL